MRLRDEYESLLILRVLNRGAGKTAIAAAKDSLAVKLATRQLHVKKGGLISDGARCKE
jgi:hypothetical protein